jgi:hypothetical protein
MSDRPDADRVSADDRQAERWLATLRDGTPDEKATARLGLAAHFEARGLVADAIGLLVANAREGYRDAELFQALARLYRALGNEYLAASAALEATRLSGRRQEDGPGTGRSEAVPADAPSSHAPWGQEARSRPEGARPEGRRSLPPGAPDREQARPDAHAVWRRPARIAGWLGVLVTLLAALGVSSMSVVSAGLYIASAAVLGVLISGSLSARRLLRLPVGPVGDGALLFGWLLLLLVAGAILPRGSGFVGAFSQPTATSEPPLYRTPSPSPSPVP